MMPGCETKQEPAHVKLQSRGCFAYFGALASLGEKFLCQLGAINRLLFAASPGPLCKLCA